MKPNKTKESKLKTWFVDAKIEIGRAYKIKAESKEEAIEMVRDDIDSNIIDEAHFEIEADAVELKDETQ